MKQINPSSNRLSGTDWQALGELKVRAGSDIEHDIRGWLAATIQPLELPADLLSRILTSAREAASRVLDFKGTSREHGHIHVLVFGPRNHPYRGQTWGFFRLEKLEDCTDNEIHPDHSIEFYLYLEGQ